MISKPFSLSYIPRELFNPLPCPRIYTPSRNFDEHNLSYEQWRSVLHLSTRWGFASLRKLALRSVKPPTPCDQLLLARTYDIDYWVLPALSALCDRSTPISLNEARQMRIEDVVLVATVREDIRDDSSKTEIPLRIEATQAKIAQAAGDVIGPTSLKSVAVSKVVPVLAEAVNAGPGAEGESDNGSKTVATSPEEDDSDKRGSDEHLVSPSAVLASSEMQSIDKSQPPKAGASVVSLGGENNKQEVEQQTQEATSENVSGDRVEEDRPSESKDGTSEKESKKTEEETRETVADLGADKVKAETADAPRIANTLTEEPEAQEQTKKPERADEVSAPPTNSRTASVSSLAQEPQPPARATPLYWRRLTARYMSVGPQPS